MSFRWELRSGASVAVSGLAVMFLAAGCANDRFSELPAGPQAYEMLAPSAQNTSLTYSIGPSDVLTVTVYEEPSLSAPTVAVGSDGTISLPLIGEVMAQGKTATELAREIEGKLSPRYLVSPSVTVNVAQIVSSRVTVDGEVNSPGVFAISGPTTLLDVIAMAKGTTRLADLDEVAVLRTVNGEQMAARFDLRAIRAGAAPNPAIIRSDTVVVGFNTMTSVWRDVLSAMPILNVFTRVL